MFPVNIFNNLGRSVTSSQLYQIDNKVETAQDKEEHKTNILIELLLIMITLSLTTKMINFRLLQAYFLKAH